MDTAEAGGLGKEQGAAPGDRDMGGPGTQPSAGVASPQETLPRGSQCLGLACSLRHPSPRSDGQALCCSCFWNRNAQG